MTQQLPKLRPIPVNAGWHERYRKLCERYKVDLSNQTVVFGYGKPELGAIVSKDMRMDGIPGLAWDRVAETMHANNLHIELVDCKEMLKHAVLFQFLKAVPKFIS